MFLGCNVLQLFVFTVCVHENWSNSSFISVTKSAWFCGHLEYSITGKVHNILIKIPLYIIVSVCVVAKLRSAQPYMDLRKNSL